MKDNRTFYKDLIHCFVTLRCMIAVSVNKVILPALYAVVNLYTVMPDQN